MSDGTYEAVQAAVGDGSGFVVRWVVIADAAQLDGERELHVITGGVGDGQIAYWEALGMVEAARGIVRGGSDVDE